MAIEFSEASLKEFDAILEKYPTKMAASLPTLHLVQHEFGYISDEAVHYVAKLLDLSPVEVLNVVSFYTMYYRKEMGKHVIQVCHTLSCALCGAKKLVDHLTKKLGIEVGETTPDKKFSLIKVECLGSCGTAPVMQINNDYYEGLSIEKVDEILDNLN